MKAFPFPDKDASREELKRDLLYARIPEQDKVMALEMAWDTGKAAARELMERYPGMSAVRIARAEGLELERVEKDNVAGNVRYFSEYYSGRKKIILYTVSIGMWSKHNGIGLDEACELILAHEIFHYLECTSLGLTSMRYTVPRFKIGSFSVGRAGIRSLSEIGAHAFAREFYQSRGMLPKTEGKAFLRNHAVNDIEFSGREKARKIFEQNPFFNMFIGMKGEKR